MSFFSRFTAATILAAGLFFYGTFSHASGYLLNEYSVTSMGRAFAGAGVVGDDLSAIASNPAGLQLFKKTFGAQVGVTVITLNGKFSGSSTSKLGTQTGNARVEIQEAVPNFFAAYSITDRLKLGFGVYVPFGLGTRYPEDSILRYAGVKSQLQVIEMAPSISYNIWRGLSVGVTANIQRASVILTQKMPVQNPDTGALIDANAGVDVSGDSWSAGGTVGIMYDFGETSFGDATRIGIDYRSQVKHSVKGDMTVSAKGIDTVKDASADMYLPNMVTLSAYHQFKAPVGLSATFRYIQWSIFDQLDIEGSGSPAIQEDWRDTVSAHVGVDWFVHEAVTLRAGVAYDMTPIKDPEHRTTRIPDNDRVLVSLGLSAKPHKNWTIDVGYTHMFVQNSSINNTHAGLNVSGDYAYDFLSYLIGAQVQFQF